MSNDNGGAATQELGVGHVLSVQGSRASVGLPAPTPVAADRATVGKFVAIRGHATTLVGMITEVTLRPEEQAAVKPTFNAVARVDLMGEIEETETGGFRFRRGVREYPAIGDPAQMLGSAELNLIYSSSSPRAIKIGHLNQDRTIPAYVDPDHLLSKHFAIVGSTGVGKSSATAAILQELSGARPDLRILLLDVHNEYFNAFASGATAIGADNLRLPFWLFNFEEITDVIHGGKPAAPEEVEILAELIPVAKAIYASQSSGQGRPLIERRRPKHNGFTADTPTPYQMQDLLALIDERMGKLENRSSRMNHNRLMMRIQSVQNDPRYEFMFKNANVGGDTMAVVLSQLFGLESTDQPITVLRLASLPDEVVDAVVCVISRLAFEFALWSEGALPLLLVCEEAHRYASADHSAGFAPARRALKRIAREGRKYGVHLALVSQRPAELDSTIISQCSTFFVMRMTSEADQALLRAAVSDAAANLLSFVPSLGAQEVIGIGEGMPLPARLTIKTLDPDRLPRSDMGSRSSDESFASQGEIVRATIERWRRATTSRSLRPEESAADAPAGAQETQTALSLGLQSIANGHRSPGVSIDLGRQTPLRR